MEHVCHYGIQIGNYHGQIRHKSWKHYVPPQIVEHSFDLRLPHGESIRARMALALDSRESALRLIDHSIADPVEHTLLLACWQQKFSERGLEDALPTYRMLLKDQSHLSSLLGRQHNKDFVKQAVKDVQNGIATGRSDAPIHTAPFTTVFPSHAAIQPVSVTPPEHVTSNQQLKGT